MSIIGIPFAFWQYSYAKHFRINLIISGIQLPFCIKRKNWLFDTRVIRKMDRPKRKYTFRNVRTVKAQNPWYLRSQTGTSLSACRNIEYCIKRQRLYAVRPVSKRFADSTKTCLYNFEPLKLHFYIVKLGFIGVYIIFSYFCSKHKLWVLVRTASILKT